MQKKIILVCLVLCVTLATLTACKSNNTTNTNDTNDTASGAAIGTKDYDVDKCVTLGNYKGVEVVTSTATDDEINAATTTFLSSNPIKEGKAKKGDTVDIKFEGKIDGKVFEGGSSDSQQLELGSNSYIEGFESGLIGKKVGEQVTLNLKFPADYSQKDYAGKDVVFTVTINSIQRKELTDDYVKALKSDKYKTVDDCKKYIKEQVIAQKKDEKGNTAFQTVSDSSTINEYPESVINTLKDRVDKGYRARAQAYGMEFGEFLTQYYNTTEDKYNSETLPNLAKEYAKSTLVCEAIEKKENLTVSKEDYDAKVKEYVTQYQAESAEALAETFKTTYNADFTEIVNEDILTTKVIELIANNTVEK